MQEKKFSKNGQDIKKQMKLWQYLLIVLMISGTTLHSSLSFRRGISDEEYGRLERLAQHFGPKTYRNLYILPEDDELNRVRGVALRVGEGLVEQARKQRDLDKRNDLIDQAAHWLCMGISLCDRDAVNQLARLIGGEVYKEFDTLLLRELAEVNLTYWRQYWSPAYHTLGKPLDFSTADLPRSYHELNRTWDWLERMVGIRVLPPAEERIAQRVAEFEKMMTLMEGRRPSDASRESADSAHTADTEPLLGERADRHLKAE